MTNGSSVVEISSYKSFQLLQSMLCRQWLMVTQPLNLCHVINSSSWTLNKGNKAQLMSLSLLERKIMCPWDGEKSTNQPTNQPTPALLKCRYNRTADDLCKDMAGKSLLKEVSTSILANKLLTLQFSHISFSQVHHKTIFHSITLRK